MAKPPLSPGAPQETVVETEGGRQREVGDGTAGSLRENGTGERNALGWRKEPTRH